MISSDESPQIRIALLHATRGRPNTAIMVRQKWLDAAANADRVEHVFAIDCDDLDSVEAMAGFPHHVVPEADLGCVAAWNLAAEASRGDVLVQLSDDWSPIPRWDEEIVRRLRDVSQPGVLRISDGYRTDDLLCMAICTRSWVDACGSLFYPGYFGVFSDDEFSFRAYQAGVVIDARDLVFRHHHPHYYPNLPVDATYSRQNDASRYQKGSDLFMERNPLARSCWLVEGSEDRHFLPFQHISKQQAPLEASKKEQPELQAKISQLEEQRALLQKQLKKNSRKFHSLLGKRSHLHLYRATARQAFALLETAKRSFFGRFQLGSRQIREWEKLKGDMAKADQLQRAGQTEVACWGYLQATDSMLALLTARSPWFRSILRGRKLETLQTQHEVQKKWWHDAEEVLRDFTGAKEFNPWGLNLTYYSEQAGVTFADVLDAASHYERSGWQLGLNPDPLLDTRYFLDRNRAAVEPGENPLAAYRRSLKQGRSPEAHSKFSGAWLRRFFLETSDSDLKTGTAALPKNPTKVEEARVFSRQDPSLCIGAILPQTQEYHHLSRVLQAIDKSIQVAAAAGYQRPQILLTGHIKEWNAEAIRKVSELSGVAFQFLPAERNMCFGAGHNHLMRHAFGKVGATHFFCLNPEGILHPDALKELLAVVKAGDLPALVEAREFPSEHPKPYDPETLETNWCSGSCLVVPRFLFELTQGFDENLSAPLCRDVDFSWRIWEQGFRCLIAPRALFQQPTASRSPDTSHEQQFLESARHLAEKWGCPRFRLVCERELVLKGFYPSSDALPAVPQTTRHAAHARVDFGHGINFANPRW